ncbi:MAG: radical SAM family heme chaperone HemW [Oscillospiraceae bacterium]|nr:radical SAM family heme chaperone HemW [Oscillospiraceae bacterium]
MKLLHNSLKSADALGIYIHIPFCAKRCSYCNFYSACAEQNTVDKYLDALISEIKNWGGKICRPVASLYIGGGTPSVLREKISLVLDAARQNFILLPDAEITVEMNPEENPDAFLNAAKSSGANRLSIGMQSANRCELLLLGRRHTNAEVKSAVKKAKAIGFNNISVDIMTGLPQSNDEKLRKTLEFAVSLDIEHISAYILKLEPKTLLYNKDLPLIDADTSANQYLLVCEVLKNHGFGHYEISNFARSGFEGRHNLKYWHCEEYIGIGPSAHSFFEGKRFFYDSDLKGFIKHPEIIEDGSGGSMDEFVMLSLRLKSGLSFQKLKTLYNTEPSDKLYEFIKMLCLQNLAKFENNTLSLTNEGMLVSNTIITEILERIV